MVGQRISTFVTIVLLAAGATLCAYLLGRHWTLSGGSFETADFCGIVFSNSCDETLQSDWSTLLGLPLAGWGLVHYAFLAALLALGRGLGADFRAVATVTALLFAGAAALVSVALLLLMLFPGTPFCPACVLVHGINLALLATLKSASGFSLKQVGKHVADAARYAIGKPAADARHARWQFVGLLTAALVAVAAYQWILIEDWMATAAHERPNDPQQTIADYEDLAPQPVAVDAQDARLGGAQASAELVVFSDFQCPACVRLATRLAALRQRYGDRLRLIFKHYPLDGQCNPRVAGRPHPRACEAAAAAEAARRQGNFWPFHDALFTADLTQRDVSFSALARRIGLDVEQFEHDRTRPEIGAEIANDVAEGNRLGISGTPALFLNGRRVYDTRLETLELLVSHELSSGPSVARRKTAPDEKLSYTHP